MLALEDFTDASLILRAGVYALCHRGVVIYVGKTKSMLTRIYTHKNMWSAKRRKGVSIPSWLPVPGIMFDQIFIRPCAVEALDSLEAAMINKYKPRYNINLKNNLKVAAPIHLIVNGVTLGLNAPQVEPIERRI